MAETEINKRFGPIAAEFADEHASLMRIRKAAADYVESSSAYGFMYEEQQRRYGILETSLAKHASLFGPVADPSAPLDSIDRNDVNDARQSGH